MKKIFLALVTKIVNWFKSVVNDLREAKTAYIQAVRIQLENLDANESAFVRWYAKRTNKVYAKSFGMQAGFSGSEILYGILGIAVLFVVLGASVPLLWPLIAGSTTNVNAMNGTDQGTAFIKTAWPIAILFAGIAIGVALIVVGVNEIKKNM